MKQILLKVSILLIIFLISALSITRASAFEGPRLSTPNPKPEVTAKKLDPRATILAKYLESHNSPLQYHAQDFIDAANKYNLDWKLVAAISGTESTFGKHIPGGFNGWGWGVYGDQALGFSSWRDGIFTVSKGLRENYVNKGYTEPYSMNRKYAASPHWAKSVTFFMNDLEKFAQANQVQDISYNIIPNIKEAVHSGLLSLSKI